MGTILSGQAAHSAPGLQAEVHLKSPPPAIPSMKSALRPPAPLEGGGPAQGLSSPHAALGRPHPPFFLLPGAESSRASASYHCQREAFVLGLMPGLDLSRCPIFPIVPGRQALEISSTQHRVRTQIQEFHPASQHKSPAPDRHQRLRRDRAASSPRWLPGPPPEKQRVPAHTLCSPGPQSTLEPPPLTPASTAVPGFLGSAGLAVDTSAQRALQDLVWSLDSCPCTSLVPGSPAVSSTALGTSYL